MNIKPKYYPCEVVKLYDDSLVMIYDWIDTLYYPFYIKYKIFYINNKNGNTKIDYSDRDCINERAIVDRLNIHSVMLDYIMKDIDNNPFKNELSAIIDVYNNGLDKWFNKEI